MGEPNGSRRRARACAALAVAAAVGTGPGCGFVPKRKLDECHQVSQTLRSENARLKDVALDLRGQNQDLSERAVDDSRRLAAQEEAVDRLEKSVQAYQAEREQMAAALETVKRQVRLAVAPHAAANPARLKAFAAAHPDWSFDAIRQTLSAPSARLFEAGGDRLRPEAAEALKALGVELSGNGGDALTLEVAGPPDAPPVARAGFEPGTASAGSAGLAAASTRFLTAARAARVRDRLVAHAGLDPSRVRLAPTAPRAADAPDDPDRRVTIRLGGDATAAAPALDAAGSGRR